MKQRYNNQPTSQKNIKEIHADAARFVEHSIQLAKIKRKHAFAFKILNLMLSFQNCKKTFPSQKWIAAQLGCHQETVNRGIKYLVLNGLLITQRRKRPETDYIIDETLEYSFPLPFYNESVRGQLSSYLPSLRLILLSTLLVVFNATAGSFRESVGLVRSKNKNVALRKSVDYSNYEHQSLYHENLYKVSELDRRSNPSALNKEDLDVALSSIRVVGLCLPEEFTLEVSLRLDAMSEFCRSVEAIDYEESDVFFSY